MRKETIYLFLILLAASGCKTLPSHEPSQDHSTFRYEEMIYLDSYEQQQVRLSEFVKLHPDCKERDKIKFLLDTIADSNLSYIRNGEIHSGPMAYKWLKWKMHHSQYRGDPIDTAEDFVTRVAVRSEKTGEPYRVKLQNGQYEKLVIILKHELLSLETALQSWVQQPGLAPASMREPQTPGVPNPGSASSPSVTSVFLPARAMSQQK